MNLAKSTAYRGIMQFKTITLFLGSIFAIFKKINELFPHNKFKNKNQANKPVAIEVEKYQENVCLDLDNKQIDETSYKLAAEKNIQDQLSLKTEPFLIEEANQLKKNIVSSKIADNLGKQRFLQVNRYIATTRGKKLEPLILNKINMDTNKQFVANKQTKYCSFGSFKISGIIDGIDETNGTLLEIKTRKKLDSDVNTITYREKIQALSYIKIFNCKSCLFVECGPDGVFKVQHVEWDELEFQKCVKKLRAFTHFARNLTRRDFLNMLN